jgi:dipeptidyl aminopeptidase/acylaminoacyl peptidase
VEGARQLLHPAEAEFGSPAWIFGMRSYDFLGDGRIACCYDHDGRTTFAVLDPETGELTDLDLPHDSTRSAGIVAEGDEFVFAAGSATIPVEIVRMDVTTGGYDAIRTSSHVDLDTAGFSIPEAIEFPTENGLTAHALYYPPRNPSYVAEEDEAAPLIVMSHGGPTAHATPLFSLEMQYWTTRGFACVDVNYGGSTGYGRAYRERLNGQWGVVDLEDCVNAARYLAEQGLADPDRLLITGGSAGGYTTICALTYTDVFAGGASYFGLADLVPFASGDTHKFESRYEHTLVGPYPEAAELYRERSPINFVDRISTPMLVLQGEDDEVVPKSQAEVIVAALQERGVPHAYLLFPGEGHGFRKAENIVRALEAELSFYAQVLGFEPGDSIPKLDVESLPA